jgi:hypothetical protein
MLIFLDKSVAKLESFDRDLGFARVDLDQGR